MALPSVGCAEEAAAPILFLPGFGDECLEENKDWMPFRMPLGVPLGDGLGEG